ncbi:MAG: transposase [Gemmataceae bacterium]|nr:transposase [Gemmataceae bacterium]
MCFDEACQQLFGEVREPICPGPGRPKRVDYEFERKDVCHQFVIRKPLGVGVRYG